MICAACKFDQDDSTNIISISVTKDSLQEKNKYKYVREFKKIEIDAYCNGFGSVDIVMCPVCATLRVENYL